MFPIVELRQIRAGDVLFHNSLGFALVDDVVGGAARLDWEKAGNQRPNRVPVDALVRDYRQCVPYGLFARSLAGRTALREFAAAEPGRTLRWLARELGGNQSRDDLMQWLNARGIVPTQRFPRWWEEAEAQVAGDPRFVWQNDRLTISPDERLARPRALPLDGLYAIFYAEDPVGRWQLAQGLGEEGRARLLAQALAARDADAICLLLRGLATVPVEFNEPLRELAVQSDPILCAVLLDRGVPDVLLDVARRASHRDQRAVVRRTLVALTPAQRMRVVLHLIERALGTENGHSAAVFLTDQVPGGPNQLLATLETDGSVAPTQFARALEWLHNRQAESTIDHTPLPVEPLLSHLRPLAPERAFPVSIALARAMTARHARGEAGGLPGARMVSGGRIELGVAEDTTPADDVQAAMRLIAELLVGAVPRNEALRGDELLAHLAALVSGVAPEWTAVAARALAADHSIRPKTGLDLWEQLELGAATARVREESPRFSAARLDVAHDTHIGLLKSRLSQTNQDALYWQVDGPMSLLVVADGISVSTAGSGNQASQILVQEMARQWDQSVDHLLAADEAMIHRFLDEALAHANRSICEAAVRAAGGDLGRNIPMGTTALVVVVRGDRALMAWLGDSRIYLVGSFGAAQLSADQNLRGEWLRSWQTNTPVELGSDGYALVGYCGHFDDEGHPRAIAAGHRSLTLLPGELLVLCSDGVTDYAADDAGEMAVILEEIARKPDLGMACRALVDQANEGGGGDNITVVLARLIW